MRPAPRLILIGAVFSASPVFAFERLETDRGQPLGWASDDVTVRASFDLERAEDLRFSAEVRRAIDVWVPALRGAIDVRYAGVGSSGVRGDGENVVERKDPWDVSVGDVERTLAHTEIVYDTTTGTITEADIFLNAEGFELSEGEDGAFDTASVVAHELGHLFGLAHTCGDGVPRQYPSCFSVPDDPPGRREEIVEAVMAPTLAPTVRRRRLGDDDLDGIAAAYPSAAARRSIAVIEDVQRACPGDQIEILGARFDPDATVILRQADGAQWPIDLLSRSEDRLVIAAAGLPETADVIVRSAVDHTSWVAASLGAPECGQDAAVNPTPPEGGGCACRSDDRSFGGAPFGMMVIVLLFARLWAARRRLAMLLVIGASISSGSDALAFKCSRTKMDSGPSLIWPQREIEWFVSTTLTQDIADRSALLQELLASYETWNAVDCSDLAFVFGGELDGIDAEFREGGPNINVVVFVDEGWAYDPSVIAVTTNAFDARLGTVMDSDIEFNDQLFTFTIADATCDAEAGTMDIRNTLTHEVGHVLGLDHPPRTARFSETTMFVSAPPCETKKRDLDQDDIDGVCTIYPVGTPGQQCFPPDGPAFVVVEEDDGFGCSASPGRRNQGAWAGLLLLGLVAVIRRR